MVYRSEFANIILSLNPYRLIACCAIYLIVRSEATSEGEDDDGVKADEQILGTLVHEAQLVKNTFMHDSNKCGGIASPNPVEPTIQSILTFNVEDIVQELKTLEEKTPTVDPFVEDVSFESLFDATETTFRPIIEKITNEKCRMHSLIFLRQLRRYKMWAFEMYDSSAKLPSGLLRGNANQLGDFDQCLSVDALVDVPGVATPSGAGEHIRGKYCLALVDVEADWPTNATLPLDEAVSRAQALGFIRSTVKDPGHFIPQFTSINWAVCLPSSCSHADLQAAMTHALTASGLKFSVRVDQDMCSVAHETTLHAATYAACIGFGLIALVAIIATIIDCLGKHNLTPASGKCGRLLMAFSVQRNWALLTADLPAEGDIHCIHGIRALCTIMLYTAHKIIPLALTPFSNRASLTQLSFEPLSMFLRASLIYTDSFLLLSGVLTAYNLSQEMQRTNRIQWTKRYVARFIRLTPALLAVLVFYAYIWEHLGDGPLWHKVVKQNADLCKENLWTNLLYIQNFFPFQQMCATHTHQLALDMQLSLLSPLLVYLLYKHQLWGVVLLIAGHVTTATLRFFVTLHNSLSLVIYHGMPVAQLWKTANLSYSLASHRATPYLMGVGVGFFLYKYGKSIRIPQPTVVFCWLTSGVCFYLSVLAPRDVAHQDYVYDRRDAALYAGYSSVTWSLALGWLICACALGHGGSVDKWLSGRWLVFTSRISFSMYLAQFAVFFYNVGSLRSSKEFLIYGAVNMEEFLIILLISIAMTLLFDLPMQELKGILTGSGARANIPVKRN